MKKTLTAFVAAATMASAIAAMPTAADARCDGCAVERVLAVSPAPYWRCVAEASGASLSSSRRSAVPSVWSNSRFGRRVIKLT